MASLLIRSIRYLVTCDDKDQLLGRARWFGQ